jgi:F-box interacting protein
MKKTQISIGLPQELIAEILSRLPVNSLLRFQCVCKTWIALIKDPTFINIHLENNRSERNLFVQTGDVDWIDGGNDGRLNLNYYLVNFSDQPMKVFPSFFHLQNLSFVMTRIIGCCNGLVCIGGDEYNNVVIWNPSIRKYKKLPFEPMVHALRRLSNFAFPEKAFAFGYDPVNNDYKVLWIAEEFEVVKLYSLKANSWRRVEEQWPHKDLKSFSNPVYLNGAFYWLVKTAARGIRLLAFNLSNEKFQEHTVPVDVEPLSYRSLDVLGGSLMVSKYEWKTQLNLELWIMKESSWSRLCTLPTCTSLQILSLSTDGRKVLVEMEMDYINGLLCWYDIKKMSYDNVLTPIPPIGKKIWAGICVKSLLLLDDGDNVD